MTDPIVMSSSSLSTMLRCGLQWKYAYVDRIKEPPKVRMVIGTATHTAVETNLVQKIESQEDLPMDVMLDAFSTAYDSEIQTVETPDEPVGKGKDDGIGLTKLHRLRVSPGIKPLAVEKQLQFTIGGHAYNTWLDLLDEVPDGTRVRDLKTAQRRSDGNNYLFQMIAGVVAYRQDSGQKEADSQIDMLVRTQKPDYHVIRWGPLSDAAIAIFGRQIDYANRMVKAGLFPANGIQNNSCSWCGYQRICPAYRAAYGNRVINP